MIKHFIKAGEVHVVIHTSESQTNRFAQNAGRRGKVPCHGCRAAFRQLGNLIAIVCPALDQRSAAIFASRDFQAQKHIPPSRSSVHPLGILASAPRRSDQRRVGYAHRYCMFDFQYRSRVG